MSPGEGVGPVHSREVPLPLTRGEIGSPLTNGNGFPYAAELAPLLRVRGYFLLGNPTADTSDTADTLKSWI